MSLGGTTEVMKELLFKPPFDKSFVAWYLGCIEKQSDKHCSKWVTFHINTLCDQNLTETEWFLPQIFTFLSQPAFKMLLMHQKVFYCLEAMHQHKNFYSSEIR